VATWISILSQALLHSIWQIALIASLLFGILKIVPQASATLRYSIALGGLYLIPVIFIFTCLNVMNRLQPANTGAEPGWSGMALAGLFFAWSLGFLILLVRLVLNSLEVRRLTKKSFEPLDLEFTRTLERLAGQLGIKRQIRIGISNYVAAPCTLSFWKPLVLIPSSCLLRLEPEELEAVLAHELAHIKQLDFLHRYVQSVMETIFYYHPMFAYISRQVSIEREHACDDLAVRVIGNPAPLATGLLKTGLLQADNELVLGSASSHVSALEKRISRLVAVDRQASKTGRFSRIRARWLALLVCLSVIGGLWGISRPTMAHDEGTRISRPLLIGLKDDVCDQLKADNIYWNPQYDRGGPAMILVSAHDVYMNGTPLPKNTQQKLRMIFDKNGLLGSRDIRMRYLGDDIKLVLTPTMEGINAKSQIFRVTDSSDTVRSFRKHVTFAS